MPGNLEGDRGAGVQQLRIKEIASGPRRLCGNSLVFGSCGAHPAFARIRCLQASVSLLW